MPLSTKQMEYLALAWACFKSEPQIDYEKFREVAGLASAHSARELMRVTKKKLHAEYGTISESSRTAAAKSTTSSAGVKKPAVRKPATSTSASAKRSGASNNGSLGAGRLHSPEKQPPQVDGAKDDGMEDNRAASPSFDGNGAGWTDAISRPDMLHMGPGSAIESPAAKRQRLIEPETIVKSEMDEDPGFY